MAHDGAKLAVTDGWYYLLVDTRKMVVDWKRKIDNMDLSKEPAMRFALKGEHFAVVKQDYDVKTIYMLSVRTGAILWRTDPKIKNSPRPMHSMFMAHGRLYGLGLHPGQGFVFVARDGKTGKRLYKTTVDGYASVPSVRLAPRDYTGRALVRVRDRQDFELNVFDLKSGKRLHKVKRKGAGDFGRHGRVSATVQNGRLVFLSKDKLDL
jgi:hypothetical protein